MLFSRLLNSQSLFIEMTKPESIEILKKMSTKGYVVPVELISGATDQTNMKKVLIGMIRANILRFNVYGCVAWEGTRNEIWEGGT